MNIMRDTSKCEKSLRNRSRRCCGTVKRATVAEL